jgi:S1-C subfamily serine protease
MLSRLRTWHLRTGFSAVVKKGVNGAATPVFFSSQTISRQQYSVAEFCELSRHSIPSCHSESLETESIAPSIRGEKKKHPERKPDCKGGGGEQVTCRFATSLNSSFRLFAASIGRSFSINQRWFSTRAVGAGGPVDRVRTADPYVATELALDAVVKIFTVSSSPNYFLPWQNKPQREVTGSGFVISRRRIVTNAHVVADQTFVLVRKHGSPIKYRADVEAVGHECDLALLRVRSEEFWEGMRELDFGEIPFLQESVAVVGYPQGMSFFRTALKGNPYSLYLAFQY